MNSRRPDAHVSRDVRAEILWEPEMEGAGSGVVVETRDGVVALSGTVDSYAKKRAAERCAQRIAGVRAVVEEIEVRLPPSRRREDAAIAQAVLQSLRWSTSVDETRVRVVVEDGVVRLTGTVDGAHQRAAADRAVRSIEGVRGLVDRLVVSPGAKPGAVKEAIERAFERHARIDASRIEVRASGGRVVLSGRVRDLAERSEAERAAWSAPGVRSVEDELVVE